MRVVLQRVRRASVSCQGVELSSIGQGLLLLVAIGPNDGQEELSWMASKIATLRVFNDEQGRMNLSVQDVQGAVLVVSQFTLYGNARKGTRPSFARAAPPEHAAPTFEEFCELLEGVLDQPVARGRFGAHMDVELLNDGPVTLILEKEAAG